MSTDYLSWAERIEQIYKDRLKEELKILREMDAVVANHRTWLEQRHQPTPFLRTMRRPDSDCDCEDR